MTIPHLCRCDDGATVVCLCDNTKDHDESGFTVSEGVWVDEPENGPDEPERVVWVSDIPGWNDEDEEDL